MDSTLPPTAHLEPASFAAVLTPHRSLGRRGFVTMMAALCFVGAIGVGRAVVLGVWPIAAFVVLDLFLLWGAFKLNYRAARAFEEVLVWPNEVCVRQVDARGRSREFRFHPVWARLAVTKVEDEGVVRLAIGSHGKFLVIGRFLDPASRESFADALGRALAAVRQQPVQPDG